MNINVTILNLIQQTQFKSTVNDHKHDQLGFIPGARMLQGWCNILLLTNVLHQVDREKE